MAAVAMLDLRPPEQRETQALADATISAEQAFLGICLYEPVVIDDLEPSPKPSDFFEPMHGRVWETILDQRRKGRGGDVIAIWSRMETDPGLIDCGGMHYLADLVERSPPITGAGDYAGIVIDKAKGRAVHELAAWAQHEIKAGIDATETAEGLEKGLAQLAHAGPQRTAWQGVGRVVDSAISIAMASTGLAGVSTGLKDLDAMTGGLRRGQMIIGAGRPGMGKSSGGLSMLKAVAGAGLGALLFSMEMPANDLGLRLACDEAYDRFAPILSQRSPNPTYFDASKGALDDSQWQALREAADRIRDLPMVFDPTPGLTVPQMLSAARRKFREWEKAGIDPGLIVVDHLTIARVDQDRRGNRVAEVGDISRGLAEMAKTLDVPVLALCQLSRDVEKRGETEKRPNLSDLRWSGEIEQDARLVMFLYRPEYYLRRPEEEAGFEAYASWKAKLEKVRHKLFWLVAKNNNGPLGEVETFCDIACSAIRDRVEVEGRR